MIDQPAPVKARFKLLDGLRLLAAVAVVAYHYMGFQHRYWGVPVDKQFPFLSGIASYGALGVQLFFIISGFVILMSAWGRSIPRFVASRVARLFPAYWVSVLAAVLLLAFITKGAMKEIDFGQVLVNLTMTQNGFGVDQLEGVYWTLWVELLFYVLIGFLLALRPTQGKVMAFVFLWPLAAYAAAKAADSGFLEAFLIPRFAPLFAGGMALYLVHKFGHSLINWLLILFNAFLAAQQTSVDHFQNMIRNTGQDMSKTACVIIVLAMFVVVALVTVTPIADWGPNWLTYAGSLTYPVYLMHENWGWWVISWANPSYGKWVALFLAYAFTFLSAALIERLVERPFTPKLRRAVLAGMEQDDRVKVPA